VTVDAVAPPELTRAEVRDRIFRATVARDEGMAFAEWAEDARYGWNRDLIDQAIDWFAQTGERFSANDIRDLLPPDTPVQGLMGSRFGVAAWRRFTIAPVDNTTSLKRNTHCKPIGVYVGSAFAEPGRPLGWWAAMMNDYRAARAAWEAKRESGDPVPARFSHGAAIACYQLEDADFRAAFPPPTLRGWLEASRRPDDEASA
jgi:hypothetical protein